MDPSDFWKGCSFTVSIKGDAWRQLYDLVIEALPHMAHFQWGLSLGRHGYRLANDVIIREIFDLDDNFGRKVLKPIVVTDSIYACYS